MVAIPVVGLWQPYASLVAIGAKPWETRHFPPPTRLVGERVAIQATLRRPTRDEVRYDLPYQITKTLGHGWVDRVPYGAIVCTAILAAGHIVRDYFEDDFGRTVTLGDWRGQSFTDDGFGDYGIGRWCWSLDDVRQLRVPIPLKGRQEVGWLWTRNAEQAAMLGNVSSTPHPDAAAREADGNG